MPKNEDLELDQEIDEDEDADEEVLDTDEDEDESTDGADEDEDSDEDEDPKAASKTEKRIRALQSQLDKAVAENNQLKKSTAPKPKAAGKPRDPEVEQLMQFALDQSRTSLYQSEPRLKQYGVGPEYISGSTPEEMQASLKSLKRLVSRIATGARNEALREHGFSPTPKDAGADKPRNFSTMDDAAFQRLVKETAGM